MALLVASMAKKATSMPLGPAPLPLEPAAMPQKGARMALLGARLPLSPATLPLRPATLTLFPSDVGEKSGIVAPRSGNAAPSTRNAGPSSGNAAPKWGNGAGWRATRFRRRVDAPRGRRDRPSGREMRMGTILAGIRAVSTTMPSSRRTPGPSFERSPSVRRLRTPPRPDHLPVWPRWVRSPHRAPARTRTVSAPNLVIPAQAKTQGFRAGRRLHTPPRPAVKQIPPSPASRHTSRIGSLGCPALGFPCRDSPEAPTDRMPCRDHRMRFAPPSLLS